MLTAVHAPARVCYLVASVPGNVVAGSWPLGGPPGCWAASRCRTRTGPARTAATPMP
jgi:hypothetical protein